jgi:YVTN family beta-propeller protein
MFQFLLGVLIFSSNLVLILWAITRANISLSSGVTLAALALPFMLMLPLTASAQNAYITNNGGNTVSVIDTATNTVSATIQVGNRPYGVAVTPDGGKVYVANNEFFGSVSVIDTATDAVVGTITVGSLPIGVAVTPDGASVYIANEYDDTVSVIDASNDTVTATILVDSVPLGVAVSQDGTKVFVTSPRSGTVSVIDTASNIVVGTIRSSFPFGVAVTPDGSKIYATREGSPGTVSVIDTASEAVIATIDTGDSPVAFGKFIGGLPHRSSPIAVKESAVNQPQLADRMTEGISVAH